MEIQSWRDIIVLVIMGLIVLFGAPIVQLIKNLLSMIIGKVVQDRWALLVSLIVACGLALLEMWLNGLLANVVLTPATFPTFAAGVFSIAQIYYNIFKKSDTSLGIRGLLKPPLE